MNDPRKTYLYILVLGFMVTVVLPGCAEPPLLPTETPLVIPSETSPPRPSETPNRTSDPPTLTPHPSLTPIPYSATAITDDFFFEGGSSPDCSLPCWNGLVVGQSSAEDVQFVLDTYFAFNERRDFFPTDSFTDKGSFSFSHDWEVSSGARYPDTFSVGGLVGRSSRLLTELSFFTNGSRFAVHLTPQRFIQVLGQPDYFLIDAGFTELGNISAVRLVMLYEQKGIVLDIWSATGDIYLDPVPPNHESPAEEDFKARICLGGDQWADSLGRSISLYPPPDTTAPEESKLAKLRDDLLSDDDLRSIAESNAGSLEAVTALAMQTGDACIDGIPMD